MATTFKTSVAADTEALDVDIPSKKRGSFALPPWGVPWQKHFAWPNTIGPGKNGGLTPLSPFLDNTADAEQGGSGAAIITGDGQALKRRPFPSARFVASPGERSRRRNTATMPCLNLQTCAFISDPMSAGPHANLCRRSPITPYSCQWALKNLSCSAMRCWLAFLKSFIAIYGCERLLRTVGIAPVEAPRSYDPIWKPGRHWFPWPIAAKRSFPNALRATSLKLRRRHRRASRGGFSDSELAPSP